jgi:hypothetical protein
LIVDTFYTAPAQLAAAIVGSDRSGRDDRCDLAERRHGRGKSFGVKGAYHTEIGASTLPAPWFGC